MNSIYSKRFLFLLAIFVCVSASVLGQRQMEKLNRGIVAVRTSTSQVFISWRLLGSDPTSTAFNLYRGTTLLNSTPITGATNYTDNVSVDYSYSVKPVINGTEQSSSESVTPWSQNYLEIPLSIPAGGTTPASVAYTYSPNDCSVGDVDGDGEYEIIVKWDPSNSKDNSQDGYTGNVYLDAYKLNGTQLWRIDLGKNIRAGAHYTQFLVYDFDGDGKAEVICKTAPGTIDGTGNYLTGAATGTDNTADYRTTAGRILSGPEYLTIFQGATGKELQTINYVVPRGTVSNWGDTNGNRCERYIATVAYINGKKPSAIMCRGYYTRTVLTAFNWDGTNLSQVWKFDTDDNLTGKDGKAYSAYTAQGYHNLNVADVDGDGYDEIIYGSMTVDHDGVGLYSTGLGHGDAQHVTIFNPNSSNYEQFAVHEDNGNGATLRDPKTGKILFQQMAIGHDNGRGLAADIDPNYPGVECWSAYTPLICSVTGKPILNSSGAQVSKPSMNFAVWWDGDVLRELLDGSSGAALSITKWNASTLAVDNVLTLTGTVSNNTTKATPCLTADILGDWREEILVRTSDNSKLRIYTTTATTSQRIYTLMHDPVYRMGVSRENAGYNQPPHTGFYLGYGMGNPPVSPMQTAKLVWKGDGTLNVWDAGTTANWLKNGSSSTFTQNDSVLFDISGSNTVNLSTDITSANVSVISAGNYSFGGSGSLAGSSTLVKAGHGTLSFNADQNYSGSTEVSEGTLLINAALNNSPVTVDYHAQIGGIGTIKSGVSLQSGAVIVPGNNGAGTLTFNSDLTLSGGITTIFDLSSDPTGTVKNNDQIVVNGNLNISSTNTIQINLTNGPLGVGTYYLINYTGTLSGSVSNISVTGLEGLVYTLSASSGTISITVPAPRDPLKLTWAGTGNLWDVNNSTNWLKSGTSYAFMPKDTILINDSGSGKPAISISGTVLPASVSVSATTTYSFSGSGSISGNSRLVKNGTGTLTISNTNSYTGTSIFNSGIVEVPSLALGGVASPLGATSADSAYIFNGGTLRISTATYNTIDRNLNINSNSATLDIPSGGTILSLKSITGSGSLIKTGAGTLGIYVKNTYTGGTYIKGGTVLLSSFDANDYGLGSGLVTLDGGTLTMLDIENYNSSNWNLYIPGTTGVLNVDGRCDINGYLAGSGTLSLYTPYVRTEFKGNWSTFSGKVNVTTDSDGGDFRVNNSNGYANIAFNLGALVNMYRSGGSGIISVGELSGVATSELSTGAWSIGGLNTSATFNGTITGTTSIAKIGTGSWTLTNANTYTSTTTVSGGSLIISNTTGSATGTGAITVGSSATLAGTGAASGTITVASGGTLSPGVSGIGTLTTYGNLVLQSGSNTAIDINKSAGTFDVLKVSGTMTMAGTLTITNTSATAFAPGNSYKIFNVTGAISGSFSSISPATPGTNMVWDLSYLASSGTIVVKGTQAISFNPPTDKKYGDAPFSLTATGGASGNAVNFAITSGTAATISQGVVTIVSAGTVSIIATQAGNASYVAATSVIKTLTIAQASQTISFVAPSEISFSNTPISLTATGGNSGNSVSLSIVSGSDVATLNGATLTILKAGVVQVKASQAGNTNYSAASDVVQTITVSKASQSVSFPAIGNKIYGDASFLLNATGSTASGISVTYSLISGDAISISGNTASVVKAGTATIRALQAGNDGYLEASTDQTITVYQASQTVTFSVPSTKTFGDAAFELNATGSNSGIAIAYSIISGDAISISGNIATIAKTGITTIRATQAGNTNYTEAYVEQTIRVVPASQSISFSIPESLFYSPTSFELTASGSATGNAISYSVISGDAISINGNIATIVKVGTATIRATQAGNENYTEVSSDQTISIIPVSQTISFSIPETLIYGDAPFELNATGSDYGNPIAYSVVEGDAIQISDNVASIVKAGTATIRATQTGNENYIEASIDRTITILAASQTISFTLPSRKVYGDEPFSLNPSGGNSGNPVVFTVISGDAVTITGATLTIIKGGEVEILASQAGNENYTAADDVIQIMTIDKANQNISIATIGSKTYGDAAFSPSLSGGKSGNSILIESLTPDVVTVANNVISIVSAGTAKLAISQLGNDGYNAAAAETQFEISKAELTVTAVDTSRKQQKGNPTFRLSYAGFVNGDSLQSLEVEPTASCTAKASSPEGTYTINVSGGEDKNYSFVYKSGTLTVVAATSINQSEESNITIYPVPVTDKLTLNLNRQATDFDVEIESINGTKILDAKLKSATQTDIDCNSLTPGIYILKTQIGEQTIVRKFIKK